MTTETKFTPGPWVVDGFADCQLITKDVPFTHGSPIGIGRIYGDNRVADAHLTAAGPELYEALELVIGTLSFDREDDFNKEVLRRINAALSKARGEA